MLLGDRHAWQYAKVAKMPEQKIMEKVRKDIAEHGWHVLSVFSENMPNFSYTIGFTETFAHPEVIISRIDSKLAHLLLNDIGELIRKGQFFEHGATANDVLKNYPVKFENVSENNILEYFRAAKNLYGEGHFKALQCIWPDKYGNFQSCTDKKQEILSLGV